MCLAVLPVVLGGCSSPSPIDLPSDAGPSGVALSATFQVEPSQVVVDYRIRNGTDDPVWVLDRYTPPAVPDSSPDGAALAMAFFAVREDIGYAQPPRQSVQAVAPGAEVSGTLGAPLPLQPFAELKGGKAVSLPDDPATIRLCVGYVPQGSLPPDSVPATGDTDLVTTLEQSVGFEHQTLVCSDPAPLR